MNAMTDVERVESCYYVCVCYKNMYLKSPVSLLNRNETAEQSTSPQQ